TALQKRVLPILHYALNPDGFLLLGTSESIGPFGELFVPVDTRHRIYRKKSAATGMLLDFSAYASPEQRARRGARGGGGGGWRGGGAGWTSRAKRTASSWRATRRSGWWSMRR